MLFNVGPGGFGFGLFRANFLSGSSFGRCDLRGLFVTLSVTSVFFAACGGEMLTPYEPVREGPFETVVPTIGPPVWLGWSAGQQLPEDLEPSLIEDPPEEPVVPAPNTWGDVVSSTIASIPFTAYLWNENAKDGVSEDIDWSGQRILQSANPPRAYCVGAVMEVLAKALKLFGKEASVDYETMMQVKAHLFIYDLESQYDGGAGILTKLGWADWVQPEDAQLGDIAQMWFLSPDGTYVAGHSVVITGTGIDQGKPALKAWSANSSGSNPGHGEKSYWIDYTTSSGNKRVWYIARLKSDWLYAQ